MQRSRRALLQRRAALEKTTVGIGRTHLYKVSLSLVFVLWGLVFLSWITHGDGDQDDVGAPVLNVSSWDESKLGSYMASGPVHKPPLASLENTHLRETCAEQSFDSSCSDGATIEDIDGEIKSGKNSTIDAIDGEIKSGENSTIEAIDVEIQSGENSTIEAIDGEIKSGENSRNNTSTGVSGSVEPTTEGETANSDVEHKKGIGKTERLTRTVPRGLDEFKKKALNSRNTYVPGATGSVIHRMEPGGGDYNYASAAKGAKVVDSNKEAKGASNILNKDKDKYLRNPCSAEEKYVVIELSEETLVDTIEVANFEHYSSNLKDFELLGSQVYPTQTWLKLGNFSAGNVKHTQRFALSEPKWVRYLKLNILSHYGSEFYCTLSSVEAYGVDAVERMLEDLISVPDHQPYANSEAAAEQETTPSVAESSASNSPDQNPPGESATAGGKNMKHDETVDGVPDPVEEVRHHQSSRMPGDTVLKILMQKVRALDLSLSVLERYLEEVNSRYSNIFMEYDKEMEEKELLLEKTRLDMKNVLKSRDDIAKEVDDLLAWRSLVSMQLDGLLKDNAMLRSDVRKVQEKQLYMESKGIVVFLISVIFGLLALFMLFTDMVNSVYRPEKSRKFCLKSSWFFLFLCCSTIIVILAL